MVDFANPINDIATAERRREVLRLSSFGSGEATELSAYVEMTDSGKICLPAGTIDSLRTVTTNGDTVFWLPCDLEPEKDDTHPADLDKNLDFFISESHQFVGQFVLPTLITPSGDKGLCLPDMLDQVKDTNTVARGFGLWLNTQMSEKPRHEDIVHEIGGLTINVSNWEASDPQGEPIEFTKREMEVLIYFANNEDRVLAREEFLKNVWGHSSPDAYDRSVDVFIRKIREKLKEAGLEDFIDTVFGVGYKVDTKK